MLLAKEPAMLRYALIFLLVAALIAGAGLLQSRRHGDVYRPSAVLSVHRDFHRIADYWSQTRGLECNDHFAGIHCVGGYCAGISLPSSSSSRPLSNWRETSSRLCVTTISRRFWSRGLAPTATAPPMPPWCGRDCPWARRPTREWACEFARATATR